MQGLVAESERHVQSSHIVLAPVHTVNRPWLHVPARRNEEPVDMLYVHTVDPRLPDQHRKTLLLPAPAPHLSACRHNGRARLLSAWLLAYQYHDFNPPAFTRCFLGMAAFQQGRAPCHLLRKDHGSAEEFPGHSLPILPVLVQHWPAPHGPSRGSRRQRAMLLASGTSHALRQVPMYWRGTARASDLAAHQSSQIYLNNFIVERRGTTRRVGRSVGGAQASEYSSPNKQQ